MLFEILEQGDRPAEHLQDDLNFFSGEVEAAGGMIQSATFFCTNGKHSAVICWLDKKHVQQLRMAAGQGGLLIQR